MLQEKGDYRGADETFRKAIAMMREVNGQQSWTLAKMLANLGLLRADEGNYAEAEQLERQALQMRQQLGGSESPDLASSQINLAEILSMRNDPAGADLLLNQAIAIRKKELPSGHPAIISAEVRLGEGLIDEGKPAEAEKILRQALAETRAVPFPLAPWHMAEAEIALGAALADTRLSPEAEHLLHDPESRLKGYPDSALRHQILRRAEKFDQKFRQTKGRLGRKAGLRTRDKPGRMQSDPCLLTCALLFNRFSELVKK